MEKIFVYCRKFIKYAAAVLLIVHCGYAVVNQRRVREVRYQHFDDYLVGALSTVNLNRLRLPPARLNPGVPPPTRDPADSSETGSGHHGNNTNRPESSTPDLLQYFRDVPREHWSCCMLGKLAGNKGFHCHARLYAARVTRRNYNRSHNRRLPMYGRRRIANYGRGLMNTFRHCVHNRYAHEFHKCCYAATIETREINRWQQQYRRESLENDSTVA